MGEAEGTGGLKVSRSTRVPQSCRSDSYAPFGAGSSISQFSHGLRHGLNSYAASRLIALPSRFPFLSPFSVKVASFRSSRPIGAVQAAVLDGFGDVLGLEICRVFQVGNRASDFQNAVVG